MKLLLQQLFVGYSLLMAIIGSMGTTILHEHNRVQEIEKESITIYQIRCNINVAHRCITYVLMNEDGMITAVSVFTWPR